MHWSTLPCAQHLVSLLNYSLLCVIVQQLNSISECCRTHQYCIATAISTQGNSLLGQKLQVGENYNQPTIVGLSIKLLWLLYPLFNQHCLKKKLEKNRSNKYTTLRWWDWKFKLRAVTQPFQHFPLSFLFLGPFCQYLFHGMKALWEMQFGDSHIPVPVPTRGSPGHTFL